MEIMLGIIATVVVLLLVFNTILLVGVAGTLTKMVRAQRGEDAGDRGQWANILRSRRVLAGRSGNDATYSDTAVMHPPPPSDSLRYWDGIPKGGRNWDGIPRTDE